MNHTPPGQPENPLASVRGLKPGGTTTIRIETVAAGIDTDSSLSCRLDFQPVLRRKSQSKLLEFRPGSSIPSPRIVRKRTYERT